MFAADTETSICCIRNPEGGGQKPAAAACWYAAQQDGGKAFLLAELQKHSKGCREPLG